jgi:hypothetical protein
MIKLLPQAQTNMLSFLGSILSWKTTRRLNSIESSSRVAAVLSVIMPEEQEGQHFQLAEKLCKAHTFPAHELLEVLLLILSNNLDLQGFDSFSNRQKKDELVMQIFHLSGLNNVQNVKYLLAQSDAIVEAVVEKLFGCAMRSYDITAIQLLLEAGINPNMPIPTHTRGPFHHYQSQHISVTKNYRWKWPPFSWLMVLNSIQRLARSLLLPVLLNVTIVNS